MILQDLSTAVSYRSHDRQNAVPIWSAAAPQRILTALGPWRAVLLSPRLAILPAVAHRLMPEMMVWPRPAGPAALWGKDLTQTGSKSSDMHEVT